MRYSSIWWHGSTAARVARSWLDSGWSTSDPARVHQRAAAVSAAECAHVKMEAVQKEGV